MKAAGEARLSFLLSEVRRHPFLRPLAATTTDCTMHTCLRSAHSPFFVHRSVLCVLLLGLSPGACINKGDTNIGRGDEVKSRSNDENEVEDAGVAATGVSSAATDSDSAQTDNSEPAQVSDDTVDPSASDPMTPVSPVASGGGSNAEGGAGSTGEASAGGAGATAGSASGGSAGATVDEAAPCTGVDIAVSVSAGRYSTCGVTPNGTVKCWGSNAEGQLGTGDTMSSPIPVPVQGLCARQVAVGSDHACAIDLTGGVQCWGYNMYGQLGNARTSNSSRPSEVAITNVKQIVAGESHTCALTEDGAIQCWGYNGYGQLGDATTDESNVPVHVVGLDDNAAVVQITAGRWHTCALFDSGTAQCWGYGAFGQLGNGGVVDSAVAPLDVLDLADATQISAGYEHVCARLEGGTVKCWGTTPSTPSLGDGVVGEIASVSAASVASGGTFTCALNTNSGVVCWGMNSRGQIGVGSLQQPAYDSPQELVGSTEEAIALALGYEHGCVVLPDNVVKCWGAGDSGQLGSGSPSDSSTPVKVQLFLP